MKFNCLSIVLYQTMFPKWIVFFFVPQSCQMLKAMTITIFTRFSMICSSYFVSLTFLTFQSIGSTVSLTFLTFQSIGSTAPTVITQPSSGGQEQGQRSVHLISSQYLLYLISFVFVIYFTFGTFQEE